MDMQEDQSNHSQTPGRQSPRNLFRLLTLRATDSSAPSGRPASIVLLCLFSLALWAGLDWLRNLPEPQFYPYAAPALAWFILAALLTAVAMARLSHPAIALSRVVALLAIVVPILLAADFAIEMYVPERWAAFAVVAPCLYAIAYCGRGLKALSGNRQPVALTAGALVAIAFLWIGSAAYVHPALWVERGVLDDTQDENDSDAAEDVLFEQSARIDASVASVVRPPGEAPAAFFVGFAGYGEQRVFTEEIKLAAQVFGQRYDTSSRTILLLNDKRDLDTQPLASVSGLRYALKGLASRMKLDRDILFLALSSHGSEEPFLSVSNGSIPLNDLSGKDLAEALSESGIQWRVIVISACYAGAFINELKDPHTIVITAAASDRTSFGCSDERDLTYFGEIFFRDSLPKAASLRDAFNTAKALISQREKQEGIEPSKPQAFFGEEMERRLAKMEHR